jgi:DNA-binding CsgD family transcriptional regulator
MPTTFPDDVFPVKIDRNDDKKPSHFDPHPSSMSTCDRLLVQPSAMQPSWFTSGAMRKGGMHSWPSVTQAVDGSPVRLSPRQREVLMWSAEGKTTWETSIIMKCTEATVNYHLRQVIRKLDATNKTHAVSRALHLGLIA